jgi:tetratricopeptide (TPR) repeat protein
MRLLWCFTLALSLFAQSDLPHRLQGAPRLPLKALQALREELAKSSPDPRKPYWESLVDYHLVWKLRGKDPQGAKSRLEQAITRLEPLQDPEAKALQGGCLDLMIGFNRATAFTLAPRAARLILEAERDAPANPRVKVFWGIHCIHIPSLFGGGSARAFLALEAAIKAAETEAAQASGDPWLPRWGLIEAITWLAEAQAEAGKRVEARATVERALALDPDYPTAKALHRDLQ